MLFLWIIYIIFILEELICFLFPIYMFTIINACGQLEEQSPPGLTVSPIRCVYVGHLHPTKDVLGSGCRRMLFPFAYLWAALVKVRCCWVHLCSLNFETHSDQWILSFHWSEPAWVLFSGHILELYFNTVSTEALYTDLYLVRYS